jgi:hypothetical protein
MNGVDSLKRFFLKHGKYMEVQVTPRSSEPVKIKIVQYIQ